jgi:hypothetical protein
MKARHVLSVAAGCLLLAVIGSAWIRHQREMAVRSECLSVLRSTGSAIAMYRQDHAGNLPPDFSAMSNYISSTTLYVCPWHSKEPGAWTNITDWMDYFYRPWPSVTGICTNYPLMYDRRLSNHHGSGVNILLVEQTVNPYYPAAPRSFHKQFFWDQGAVWLKKFATDHPELRIPMPEDLQESQ